MKNTNLRASSNRSWLEAAQMLISAAQEENKRLRSLNIKEDQKGKQGKYSLITHLG